MRVSKINFALAAVLALGLPVTFISISATASAAGNGHDHGSMNHGATDHSAMNHGEMHHNMSMPGQPGLAADVSRTIAITAHDTMRFAPGELQVEDGETIRFVVTNGGRIPHQFNIATEAGQLQHIEMMRQSMGKHTHDMPHLITLQPGETGTLIWRFSQQERVQFGCNLPGHYEAGMKGEFRFH